MEKHTKNTSCRRVATDIRAKMDLRKVDARKVDARKMDVRKMDLRERSGVEEGRPLV